MAVTEKPKGENAAVGFFRMVKKGEGERLAFCTLELRHSEAERWRS